MESLGLCCYCREENATTIAMLPFKLPRQHRREGAWGCLICGLREEGAMSVFCDECAGFLIENPDESRDYFLEPWVCIGFPQRNMRERIRCDQMEPHEHDVSVHEQEEL
jgi:hypothetical protein